VADNINEVIAQAEALGFLGVTAAKLVSGGRYNRFRVEGYKQRDAGRITLFEIALKNGKRVFVGGIWIMDGAGAVHYEKIDLSSGKDKYGSTTEERKKIAAQIKAQQAATEAAERAKANKAALKAEKFYHNCKPAVPSSALYLSDKQVNAYDIRMTSDGAAVVAIRGGGRIVALQFLLSKNIPAHAEKIRKNGGGNKKIWPFGCKIKGGYHWIGGIPRPGDVIVLSEGYATAASIYKATGLICVVVFYAGNIKPVVDTLLEQYPDVYLLIAADDDDLKQCPGEDCRHRFMLSRQDDPFNCPECKRPHKRNNAGRDAALKACGDSDNKRVNYLLPRWSDNARRLHAWGKHGNKRTDYNDLMLDEGDAAVRLQFERYIADLRLRLPSHAERVATLPAQDDGKKKYIVEDLPTALWRFVLIADGGDSVYDMLLRKIIKMSDARNQFHTRDLYRRWQEATEPDKRVITMDDIRLDFAEEAIGKPGNSWGGFATKPIQNDEACNLIEPFILDYICNGVEKQFDFLMCCMAHPIKNPGQSVDIGTILQSDEGSGKGLLGKILLRPYGRRYGIVLNQNDLEDRFNAHMDNILLCIFEEIGVGGGKDGHKLKNLLKHMITGETTRINPKQVNGRMTENRTIYYFFTNELLPFLLGNQGRRWNVLRQSKKIGKPEAAKVVAQIMSEEGGNGWHYKLENYESKYYPGFSGYEEPPENTAKAEMLELSKDLVLLFWEQLTNGEIIELEIDEPMLNADLYELFEVFCKKGGAKNYPSIQFFIPAIKRQEGVSSLRASFTWFWKKPL
jgi:putative DNA primase/helicase